MCPLIVIKKCDININDFESDFQHGPAAESQAMRYCVK